MNSLKAQNAGATEQFGGCEMYTRRFYRAICLLILLYKIQDEEATATVSAVLAVLVMTAAPSKLNHPLFPTSCSLVRNGRSQKIVISRVARGAQGIAGI